MFLWLHYIRGAGHDGLHKITSHNHNTLPHLLSRVLLKVFQRLSPKVKANYRKLLCPTLAMFWDYRVLHGTHLTNTLSCTGHGYQSLCPALNMFPNYRVHHRTCLTITMSYSSVSCTEHIYQLMCPARDMFSNYCALFICVLHEIYLTITVSCTG